MNRANDLTNKLFFQFLGIDVVTRVSDIIRCRRNESVRRTITLFFGIESVALNGLLNGNVTLTRDLFANLVNGRDNEKKSEHTIGRKRDLNGQTVKYGCHVIRFGRSFLYGYSFPGREGVRAGSGLSFAVTAKSYEYVL